MSCFPGLRVCVSVLCAALCAVLVAGCDAYQRKLIGAVSADAGLDAGRDSGPDGPGPTPDGGPDSGVDPASCMWGECWWSGPSGEAECRSARLPSDAARPPAARDGTSEEPALYFGFTKVRVGQTNREGEVSEDAWQDFGLDLDGVCTNSATCSGSSAVSCRSATSVLPYDGQLCRDNTLARLQPVVAEVPEIGERYGLSESVFNCALWRGSYNFVMRITGYNGQADDSRVRVDYYRSTGLEEALPWQCAPELTDFHERYPRWRSSLAWRVDAADLTEPVSADGTWPDALLADADAYVKNGYLISKIPNGANVGFIGDGAPHRGFVLRTQHGHVASRLHREQDGTWSMSDGIAAGRIRNEDLVLAFREVGFCELGETASFYESMVSYVQENADVLASGESSSELPCDAMSYAIGFEAAQITPGTSEVVPPRIECCPPGKSDEQCNAVCGDGKVTGDEACDTAIAAGAEGACPTECTGGDACAPLALTGAQCEAECAPAPIREPAAGDGCCPEGANAQIDSDCAAQCGNGVIETGETCDPPGTCPSCETEDACLPRMASGSAETCDVRCAGEPLSACGAGDGCCPSDCSSANDPDCSSTCGNGALDDKETCEANTERPCPSSCDDGDACTVDHQTGSAGNCNLRCQHTTITDAADGDGCCPAGATSNTDSECGSECGNRVVEADEQCDDGNDLAGDGCVNCMLEGIEQTCLARLGQTTACAMCTCRSCAQEAIACQGNADETDARLCDEMVVCARQTGCRADACYCGSAGLLTCLSAPAGPCSGQVARAAKTNSALDIQARQTDPAYPLQRAIALGACVDDNCAQDCL